MKIDNRICVNRERKDRNCKRCGKKIKYPYVLCYECKHEY
jgi:hypothetical protein